MTLPARWANVGELLAEAEREHGARTAFAGSDVTYAALAERCRCLAGYFADRGVAPGERVSILAPNVAEYVEVYLAAGAAGLVLNPLNTRLALREQAEIVGDAQSRLLVAHPDFAGAALELGLPILWLGEGEGGDSLETAHAAEPRDPAVVEPDAPAHLYYTSGTTGRSKGVVLTHRNVCRHAQSAIRELAIDAGDTWGHFAPQFHLADAWASFAVTAAGGTHTQEPHFDPRAVLERMRRDGVTLTNLVPTMIARMLEELAREPEDDPGFGELRLLLSGGAPIAPAQVGAIESAFGCEYAQTYGMTETSPYLTLSLPALGESHAGLAPEERLRLRARTGRPFLDVELEVRAADGSLVPRDDRTVGEIFVRGETVTPGYWQRPEETERALSDGWLATGDLAVIDEAGRIDIVDRKKDMILSGGENVFSTEVEHVLVSHPNVSQAAVVGVPDAAWGERVCAAVVPAGSTPVDLDALERHCRERIAGYKVPRTIHVLDALPMTGSGKVHKPTLREEFGSS